MCFSKNNKIIKTKKRKYWSKSSVSNWILALYLVGWNLRGMKNIIEKMWIFYCLEREENEKEWKTKKKLSLRPTNSCLPNWGGKARREKLSLSIFTILASQPTLISFTPTHLMTFAHKSYHFFFFLASSQFSSTITAHQVQVLFSFFFFFSTWSTVSCCHYASHPSIVSCWFFGFGWHSIYLHYNNKNNNINLFIWYDKFYII